MPNLEVYNPATGDVLGTFVVSNNLSPEKIIRTIDNLVDQFPEGSQSRWQAVKAPRLSNQEINELCQSEIHNVLDQQTQMNLSARFPFMDEATKDAYADALEWIDRMVDEARKHKSSQEPTYSIIWPEPPQIVMKLAEAY